MSDRMKLRATIRAPSRYGESNEESPTAVLLQSMRRARGESTLIQNPDGSTRLFQRKPNIEFDPNLPPAAFPTVDLNRPTGSMKVILKKSPNRRVDKSPSKTGRNVNFSLVPGDDDYEMENVSLNDMENYAASNTMLNPVYVKNMEVMTGKSKCGDTEECADPVFEDSDLDEPDDTSVILGKKIPNPTWADIMPALQVEIIENMFKAGSSWSHICAKLDLQKGERNKFREFLKTRNQQFRRENLHLAKMRDNQLHALMQIDNSNIKTNDVPHQLVLRRLTEQATYDIMSDRLPDLLMCQAADILAARQYLRRRSLSQNLAGEWDHSLVVLRQPDDENSLEPEQFKWKENLNLAPELTEEIEFLRDGDNPVIKTRRGYIQCVAGKDTVYLRDVKLKAGEKQPSENWRKSFRNWDPENQVQKSNLDHEGDGLVRLMVGHERAAQIHQFDLEVKQEGEDDDTMMYLSVTTPQRNATPIPDSSPCVAPDDTPMRKPIKPKVLSHQLVESSSPPLDVLQVGKEIHKALALVRPKRLQIPLKRVYDPPRHGLFSVRRMNHSDEEILMPVKRSLGGCWSMSSIRFIDPAVGQERYMQQIEEARYEAGKLEWQKEFNKDVEAEHVLCKEQQEGFELSLLSPIRDNAPDDMFRKYLNQRDLPPSDKTYISDSDFGNSWGDTDDDLCGIDLIMKDYVASVDVPPRESKGDQDSLETIDTPVIDASLTNDSDDEMVMIEDGV
ncbi:hypothetical protein N7520_009774 [Penicillium odoratum]|uniref:uncharacterized protein n=1 Tax=Penicillium odoratum TaxID=1167516 RepID=UPI002546BE81|nr:uncharacterized protein N7520_009774 [Penicillium odoratum]KAJ5752857.1 hypothetical protein N7520_009774 [Penicillium odoratum]